MLSSNEFDTNILSLISTITLHWQISDKHNIHVANIFCSKWTSHRILNLRHWLRCGIALRNPFAKTNQRLYIFITLAIDIVCCSITSWIAVLSPSIILSNSSIQHTPWSAKTSDPPSNVISPVIGSLVTEAVKPTPDDPLPVVYWPWWE